MATLDGDGLYPLTWDEINKSFTEPLVASPADEHGRGIRLTVTRHGETVTDLGTAKLYLLWRHRVTRAQGCEPFETVRGSAGVFDVYYPTAMTLTRGTVDAQVMISFDETRELSTRTFLIRVERVLIDGTTEGDGFSLFRDAIKKYEDGAELSHEAADAATAAAERANASADAADTAASGADEAAADARAAAQEARTSAAGADAAAEGANAAATGANEAAEGAKAAAKTATDASNAAIESAASASAASDYAQQVAYELSQAAERGDFDGEVGPPGTPGKDGVSCTHLWNGTTLTVTSASGTSSADLKGPKGDPGPPGGSADIVAMAPLSYVGNELSIDLSGYATTDALEGYVTTDQLDEYATKEDLAGATIKLTDLCEMEY